MLLRHSTEKRWYHIRRHNGRIQYFVELRGYTDGRWDECTAEIQEEYMRLCQIEADKILLGESDEDL